MIKSKYYLQVFCSVYLAISFGFSSLVYAFPESEIERDRLPEAQWPTELREYKDVFPDKYLNFTESKKVALYVGKGTWSFGKAHFKRLLLSYKHSYEVITAKDVLSGKLNVKNYSILIMPGGKSWKYIEELGSQGADEIKRFVALGGGYLGICAGAYYAVSHRLGPSTHPEPYGIGLLRGVALDGTSLKVSPFHGGMMKIKTDVTGFPGFFQILMLGGASFHFDPIEGISKKIKILGTIDPIHFPTLIYFQYGKGKVFLSGPHGEIEEKGSLLGLIYKDPDSEWPLLEKIMIELASPK